MADPVTSRALIKSTGIGTVLQVLMVVAGHYVPAIAGQFAAGGMAISALAGILFSRWSGRLTAVQSSGGGLAAGAISAFIGILVSYFLGDVPAAVLGFGTAGSGITGAIGGLLGRMFSTKSVQPGESAAG